jgi:hypothetical protein
MPPMRPGRKWAAFIATAGECCQLCCLELAHQGYSAIMEELSAHVRDLNRHLRTDWSEFARRGLRVRFSSSPQALTWVRVFVSPVLVTIWPAYGGSNLGNCRARSGLAQLQARPRSALTSSHGLGVAPIDPPWMHVQPVTGVLRWPIDRRSVNRPDETAS